MKHSGTTLITLALCLVCLVSAPARAQPAAAAEVTATQGNKQDAVQTETEGGNNPNPIKAPHESATPKTRKAGQTSATAINPLRTGPFNASVPGVRLPIVYGMSAPRSLPGSPATAQAPVASPTGQELRYAPRPAKAATASSESASSRAGGTAGNKQQLSPPSSGDNH